MRKVGISSLVRFGRRFFECTMKIGISSAFVVLLLSVLFPSLVFYAVLLACVGLVAWIVDFVALVVEETRE